MGRRKGEIMCKSKRRLFFLSLLCLSFSLSAYSQETNLPQSGAELSALLDQSLPSFPVSEGILNPVSVPQTQNLKPLIERMALQLEAWIAYHEMVKVYVSQANDWSIQVTDSWNQVKASSKKRDEAVQKALESRDAEIKALKSSRLKGVAIGVSVGFSLGVIASIIAR